MDEKGQPPLRQKGQRKGIMVSGFLTPGGRLQVPEHITNEAANHLIIFYPKFHCELNFIERFGALPKVCKGELRVLVGRIKMVPAALDSVSAGFINRYYNHCSRVIESV